jgi:hypothetical protein
MSDSSFQFSHGEAGITRFPPNVEQISVERESLATWLVVRRNDVILRFPLRDEDCRHLAALLTGQTPAPNCRESVGDRLAASRRCQEGFRVGDNKKPPTANRGGEVM